MVFGRRKFTSSSSPNEAESVLHSALPDALQTAVGDPNEIKGKRNSHNDHNSDDENEDDEEDMEQAPKTSTASSSSSTFRTLSQQSQIVLTENYKFGILERLNHAVARKLTNSATASHRSPDLIPLMKSFDILRKKLRHMIATTKKYHESMINLDSDRVQVIAYKRHCSLPHIARDAFS